MTQSQLYNNNNGMRASVRFEFYGGFHMGIVLVPTNVITTHGKFLPKKNQLFFVVPDRPL